MRTPAHPIYDRLTEKPRSSIRDKLLKIRDKNSLNAELAPLIESDSSYMIILKDGNSLKTELSLWFPHIVAESG